MLGLPFGREPTLRGRAQGIADGQPQKHPIHPGEVEAGGERIGRLVKQACPLQLDPAAFKQVLQDSPVAGRPLCLGPEFRPDLL